MSSAALNWLEGPIAVTGASGQVGRALLRGLESLPNEVRAAGRGADLHSAFRDADAVIHLAGTLLPRRPNSYRSANLETVLDTLRALEGSAAKRLLFLSFITADAGSSNEYLRSKGEAEQAISASGIPAVVLRCDHIYGPPDDPGPTAAAFLAKRRTVRVLGSGAQRLAPLYRGDVAEVLTHAACDPATPTGSFELAGPETMTITEFVGRLNETDVRIRPTPAPIARLLARISPILTPALVEVMLADAGPSKNIVANAARFGVQLRRVDEIWRAT